MKNDIDSILDSMFRGGRLQFKSNQQPEKPEETSSEPTSAFHTTAAQEAQQALDAVARTGDSLSESLQQSLERLTQEARADMADLERHLRQDGIDTATVTRNAGAPVDLEMAFQVARQEAGSLVLGSLPLSAPLWREAATISLFAGRQSSALTGLEGTAPCGVSPRPWGGRGSLKARKPPFWIFPVTMPPDRKSCSCRTFTLQ